MSRAITDFRENYRGTIASQQDVDQHDLKFDWNASRNDKLYVRYSRQTSATTPQSTVMPLSFASASDNPYWGMAANWNRIFGTAIVNDLLIGYTDASSISDPIDPLSAGKLNNQLGIAGDQRVARADRDPVGQRPHRDRQRRDGNEQLQHRLSDQRAADVAEGPPHAEVRRLVELLSEPVPLSGNNGRNGFIAYNAFNFTGAPFADFLLDQVSQKGRGFRRRRGRTCSIASASSPPTTSRSRIDSRSTSGSGGLTRRPSWSRTTGRPISA